MRVKMLKDAPGSPDGVTVVQYLEGKVHELGEDLAQVFVREGLAEKVEDDAEVHPTPAPQPRDTDPAEPVAVAPDPEPEPEDEPEPADESKQDAGPDENKAAN